MAGRVEMSGLATSTVGGAQMIHLQQLKRLTLTWFTSSGHWTASLELQLNLNFPQHVVTWKLCPSLLQCVLSAESTVQTLREVALSPFSSVVATWDAHAVSHPISKWLHPDWLFRIYSISTILPLIDSYHNRETFHLDVVGASSIMKDSFRYGCHQTEPGWSADN